MREDRGREGRKRERRGEKGKGKEGERKRTFERSPVPNLPLHRWLQQFCTSTFLCLLKETVRWRSQSQTLLESLPPIRELLRQLWHLLY